MPWRAGPAARRSGAVVHRRLRRRAGRAAGVLGAFALSSVLHEVASSVPVRVGLGLPLAYFVVHGGLVLLDGQLARRGRPVGGAAGRAWALVWLAAPLVALFLPPFLRDVVWPLGGSAEVRTPRAPVDMARARVAECPS